MENRQWGESCGAWLLVGGHSLHYFFPAAG
jgi:hypothetical protein